MFLNLCFCLLLSTRGVTVFAETKKSITIGAPLNSPPFVNTDEKHGIEMDLISSVFKKLGYSILWRHLPPKRIRHQVMQREINVGIRTRPIPGDILYYSQPYIQFQNVAIAIDPNIQVKSIQDLAKYNVVAFQNAKDVLGSEYSLAVGGGKVYLEMADQAKQIETLFRRRSQVIIMEERIFSHFQKKSYPKSEVKIFEIFPSTPYSAIFYDKNLRDDFDRLLASKNLPPFGN